MFLEGLQAGTEVKFTLASQSRLFHILDEDGGGSISKDEFKFALSRWMRESKTANHFVKYMVSNLSVNQSQLQDQVRQISRAVATLAADLQGMHQKQDADASTLRRVEESLPSKDQKLTKTKSSKSLDAATAQTLQVVTLGGPPSPENASQLPTLLQRLDDGHCMEVQAMPDETRPSMSAILQLLQDCRGDADALLLKKKRLAAAANEVDRSLKTTLDKASVAMQRWTLLQPGILIAMGLHGYLLLIRDGASDGQTETPGEAKDSQPGSAANIAADIIAEGQAAIEEDGIPWEQVGPFFIAAVVLANSAQFIYPLMEEAMEEDDYDRLPMPSGRPGARRQRVEEVDLKLPPKPQSQIVAEATAKKVEKKKDVDMDFEESQRSA
eukprot:s2330_g8.t1